MGATLALRVAVSGEVGVSVLADVMVTVLVGAVVVVAEGVGVRGR